MPPPAIRTVRDLIYWQYSKTISESAGMGKKNWRFIMDRFQKLQQGEIFWNEIREYVKEHENPDECIYCGAVGDVTLEHLFPQSLGGPQDEKNVVWVCQNCNSSKGARRPYEWYTKTGGLKDAKYNVPRIAEGKYLKLAFEIIGVGGPKCDLGYVCEEENSVGRLSPLCLDGMVTISLH
jgi:5-methylcytosine-specific restriction endonuclease McrA